MEAAKFSPGWIDYTIVIVCFLGVIGHGLHISRKNKGSDSDGCFLAGRNRPRYLIGFSLFASNCRAPASWG